MRNIPDAEQAASHQQMVVLPNMWKFEKEITIEGPEPSPDAKSRTTKPLKQSLFNKAILPKAKISTLDYRRRKLVPLHFIPVAHLRDYRFNAHIIIDFYQMMD